MRHFISTIAIASLVGCFGASITAFAAGGPGVPADPELYFQGHASMRITTPEAKVIYIDPFDGDGYDVPADLILVTHSHMDHNKVELIQKQTKRCETILWTDALKDGEHKTFDLGYVTIEAVEAGNNKNHNIEEFVGYVLTFSNGASLYVTGDTSTTQQMPLLAEKNIDYAFFCCDGTFNMGIEEATKCAEAVSAVNSYAYHTPGNAAGDALQKLLDEQAGGFAWKHLAPKDTLALVK